MKKRIKTLICMLLVGATLGLSACSFSFDGLLGGNTTNDGSGNTGNTNDTTGGTGGNGGGSGGSIWDKEDPSDENGSGGSGGSIWDKEDEKPLPTPIVPDTSTGVELPVELDFAPQPLEEQYGYRYFYALEDGEKFCRFYVDLYDACCALQYQDVEADTQRVKDENGNVQEVDLYIVDTLNWAQYNLTAEEAIAVWKTVRMEFPEFYWIDHTVTFGTDTLNLHIYEEYRLGETRRALQDNIERTANDCLGYLTADMTALEISLTIYDYVITSMYYEYETDGVTPSTATSAHNLIGFTEYGKGVCETYAKAFEYLQSLIGIETLTVSGVAGVTLDAASAHAWNIVNLDGVWYNVDLTWGDQQDTDGYLHREWFASAATSFATTHAADVSTVAYNKNWQYALPELSNKAITPVRMQEGSGTAKTYMSIDAAFEDITDAAKTYTITLCPSTSVTSAKSTKLYLNEYTFAGGDLPQADILFVGRTEQGRKVSLRAKSGITLWSNIYLQEVDLTYPSLYRNGYSITAY